MQLTRRDARMIAEELYRLMSPQQPKSSGRMLSTREAARFLGYSLSTIYHNLERIPHVRIGRSIRFPEEELREYTKNSRL